MKRQPPKWCTARHNDAECQLRYDHDGDHRAEVGPPIRVDKDTVVANVVSWS